MLAVNVASEWDPWLDRNRDAILGTKTNYEWTFANRILCRVNGLDPANVQVQQAFTDLDGKPRRMDFSIVEGNVQVAIEVDGYNKVPGSTTGMTHDQFVYFLRRQNSLTSQGWMVLRFANKDFTKNPGPCIRQIELALQQARAAVGKVPGLSPEDADELNRLRRDSNDVKALDQQLLEAGVALKEAKADQRRAELSEARVRTGRRWVLVGAAVVTVVAIVIGVLYATRDRLPGVPPDTRTTCPADHLIKGNRSFSSSQKIYHVPGGAFYDQTTPIRCFVTEDEAAAAGYRRSKR